MNPLRCFLKDAPGNGAGSENPSGNSQEGDSEAGRKPSPEISVVDLSNKGLWR